jgi:hypothetical protein
MGIDADDVELDEGLYYVEKLNKEQKIQVT